MADVFDRKKRSDVMSRIRGKGNRTTEQSLAAGFRQAGIKGWRRHVRIRLAQVPARGGGSETHKVLIARPDFLFRRERLAVFADGCFWHGCERHQTVPATNRPFWKAKLARNVERDRLTDRGMKKAGWRVVRIWEHELTLGSRRSAVSRVQRLLRREPM